MSEVNLSGIFGNLTTAGQNAVFKSLDTDGDGKISKEEFEEGIKEYGGEDTVTFSSVDTDGDGTVSREEFEAAIGAKIEEEQNAEAEVNNTIQAGNTENAQTLLDVLTALLSKMDVTKLLEKLITLLTGSTNEPEDVPVEEPAEPLNGEDYIISADELNLPEGYSNGAKISNKNWFERLFQTKEDRKNEVREFINSNLAQVKDNVVAKLEASGVSHDDAVQIAGSTFNSALERTITDLDNQQAINVSSAFASTRVTSARIVNIGHSYTSMFTRANFEKLTQKDVIDKFLSNFNSLIKETVGNLSGTNVAENIQPEQNEHLENNLNAEDYMLGTLEEHYNFGSWNIGHGWKQGTFLDGNMGVGGVNGVINSQKNEVNAKTYQKLVADGVTPEQASVIANTVFDMSKSDTYTYFEQYNSATGLDNVFSEREILDKFVELYNIRISEQIVELNKK